MKSKSSKLV